MKLLKSLMIVGVLSVFAISCASKKKDGEDVGGVEGQALDSSISSQGMNYDQMGSDSGNISGLNSINFDYDSATLSTEARKTLAENAEWIRSNSSVTVQIEGHCDSRGSVEYNLALGERRAKAVKSYLTSLGVESKRMTIISYGEEKPIALGDTDSDYAKNRRANFVPLQ